jgi:hypothetical protein
MARIYIETTVVSFYYNVRSEPEMISRQNWTRRWLDKSLDGADELVTSLAVENELNAGDFPMKSEMLDPASRFPLLDLTASIAEVVEAYISNHVMPNDPGGDALHLAAASFHRCDFLVTWNCKHIANANKFGHIRRINGMLGLGNPALVTPLELLNEDIV